MDIHFTKMHGLGNDFIVLNNLDNEYSLSTEQISLLGNRHSGIGFDQLLVIDITIKKCALKTDFSTINYYYLYEAMTTKVE